MVIVRSYIVSVISVSALCAVCKAITEKLSIGKRTAELVSGILLLAALVQPLRLFPEFSWKNPAESYRIEGDRIAAEAALDAE